MSEDNVQTESGADMNALRNNIPVGESRDYKIAATHMIPGFVVIAAWVSDTDVDVDTCVLADTGTDWRPKKGDLARFTRTGADGALVVEPVDVA